MTRNRDGIALALALVLVVTVMSFTAVALLATVTQLRLASAQRLAIEGQLIASSALAHVRVDESVTLAALADGATRSFGPMAASGAWRWRATAHRVDSLVRVESVAWIDGDGGIPLALQRRSLILMHLGTDTVQVLTHRPGF